MPSIIKPGFRGYAEIAGTTHRLRFNTCGLNATQDVEAPDLVMGDDTHNAWAYGKIDVAGSTSGPVTESTGTFIDALEANLHEEDGVTINIKYYEGYTRAFSGCRLNSFTFNVSAGEVVNFSIDIIGVKREDVDPPDMLGFTKGEKLVTWDKSSIRVASSLHLDENGEPNWSTLTFLDGLQSFAFTASNNFTRQFVLGRSDLFGDLVEGMKAVTGNITSYTEKSGEGLAAGANYWDQYEGDYAYPVRFDIGNNLMVNATVRFSRGTTELSTGPIVTAMNFTGVTHWGRGSVEEI